MDISLIKKLSEASGVSGFESEVREIIKKEVEKYADSVRVDNMGNLIALKKGAGKNKKKVALVAHMDEIGLLVKRFEKGFVEFTKIGGIDNRILLSQRVIIKGKKDIEGVIGSKPIHLQKKEEWEKVIKHDDMYIEVGLVEEKKKKGEKKEPENPGLGIELGLPISFKSEFRQLQKNTYCGKALDNRLGVYALIDILKRTKKPKNDLYFVFSTQEEVGLKGARTATYSINPDLAIILDTSIAGDTPMVSKKDSELALGKGVSITIIEAGGQGIIVPEAIRNYLVNTAKENKIKYQLEIVEGGMTDAAIVQLIKEGILCGSLGIPVRNIHTPNEIFDGRDLAEAIKLTELTADNWK
jgi:endoglucanase